MTSKLSASLNDLSLKIASFPRLKHIIGAGILSLSSCAVNNSLEKPEAHSCCSGGPKAQQAHVNLEYRNIETPDIKIRPSKNPPSLKNMALIPARTVTLGGGKEDTLPAYKVNVEPFYISKTETTNREFARFVKETGYKTTAERPWAADPKHPNEKSAPASLVFTRPNEYNPNLGAACWWKVVEGANWKHPEGPGSNLVGRENLPVVHITLEDAMAYATWAGGEIPTEAQFRAAAAANPIRIPAKAAKPNPKEVNFYQGTFPLKDLAEDGHAGMAPVASYKPNQYGAYDLIGNGWELTRTYNDNSGKFAVIAGGSFLCSWDGFFTCTNASAFGHTSQELTSSSNHVTFRIIKKFSPAEE